MRPILVLFALSVLSACDQAPAGEAKSQAIPGQTRPAAPPKSLVGRVFEADYRKALCNWPSGAREAHLASFDTAPQSPMPESPTPEQTLAATRAVEKSTLASTLGRARREGSVLIVSGERFADNPEEGDGWGLYDYLGRLAKASFDIVHGAHWEWDAWYVVDAQGAHVALGGPPVPSPNGLTFAATGDDVEGESLNGVEIADYTGGDFRRTRLEVLAPCNPRWLDNDTLEVKLLPDTARGEAGPMRAGPSDWKVARIVRDGKGWKLVQPAA